MVVGGCLVVDGPLCGTAVAANTHLGLGKSKVAEHLIEAVGVGHRLQVCHNCGIYKGGFHTGSLYCITGIGLKAKANDDLLEKVGSVFNATEGPWILCMVGNRTPAELVSTGWFTLVTGVVHAPS